MHHRSAKCFALINVGSLHPAGIALLAPVDKRRLTMHQPRLLVIDGLIIILKRILHHRIDFAQPILVAGGLVNLESRHSPYLAVGADRPCTPGTCILHNPSTR